MFYSLIAGLSAAAAASLLGNFVVLERLSLAADVLSHVALPGIALGIAVGINPFLGAFLFLILAAVAIWGLERKTRLPLDALIGIIFTASLALGALFLKEKTELLEALFGNLGNLGWQDALIALVGGAIVIFTLLYFLRPMLLTLLSPELASAQGIRASRMRFLFLILLALAVAIGIKVAGILLVGALLILPPAIAQNVSAGIRSALVSSFVIGLAGTAFGIWLAFRTGFEGGPIVVLVMVALFALSLVLNRWILKLSHV